MDRDLVRQLVEELEAQVNNGASGEGTYE